MVFEGENLGFFTTLSAPTAYLAKTPVDFTDIFLYICYKLSEEVLPCLLKNPRAPLLSYLKAPPATSLRRWVIFPSLPISHDDLDALYESYAAGESTAKSALITFEEQYPDVLLKDNLDDVLSHLMERQNEPAP